LCYIPLCTLAAQQADNKSLKLGTETTSVLEDKSSTQDTLEGFLKSRPTPRDLVEKNILQESNADDTKQQRKTKLAGFLSKRHAKPPRKGKHEEPAPRQCW
jgi:RPEL repeat